MARAPYKPIEELDLRPVATPLDTFVRPQEPSRDTTLQDLARSLSGLGGNLGEMLRERQAKADEDDAIRGEAAFHQNNQQGFAEAVASGAIPAQYSKSFMRAYKKAQGDVVGADLEQKLQTAYDAWDGKTSTDPKAYDAFVAGFLKDNVRTQDPDILRGLLPRVRQATNNFLTKHISDASKATMEGALKTEAARNDQLIEQGNSAGLSTRKGTDYPAVFEALDRNREAALKSGVNAEKYDEQVVEGITASAVKLRDPKVLDFLDRKVPGKDYTWGNTPYGRDQKQKAIDTLERMGRQSISDDEKARREARAAAKDDVTRRTIQAITAKPNEPIPEDLLSAGERVDPDFRVNAITWRDKIAKGGRTSDTEELLGVTRDVLNGGGIQVVQRAMERGVFKNSEDLTSAYKLAEHMQTEGPKLEALLKGGSAKTILDTIKQRTAADKDASKFFDDGSVSNEGLQAQQDFKLQVLAWRQANPDANAIEQEKAVQDIGAGILKRIVQPEAMGQLGYDRGGIDTPNTHGASGAPEAAKPQTAQPAAKPTGPAYGDRDVQVPSELPGAAPAEPTARPAAPVMTAPTPPPANPEQAIDAGSWFNGQSAELRAAIERKAAEEKKPLSLKVEEVYRRGVSKGLIKAPAAAPGKQSSMVAPDGTPIETASVSGQIGQALEDAQDKPPPADTVRLIQQAFERALGGSGSAKSGGNYSLAALRNDPKAAHILDFISGPESGGNYNAYFGHGNSTLDLGKFSLAQLQQWMGSRGTASSATGRYQFMKATLFGKGGSGGLVQELGLDPETKFTPELQDRLAIALLNRRGYSQWRQGRISDAEFANRLALEWASLPNITAQNGRPAGVSAYAGDGLNKSLVRPGDVLAALQGGGGESAGGGSVRSASAPARESGLLGSILGMLTGRGRKPPPDAGTRV